jgi:hypothetical protein
VPLGGVEKEVGDEGGGEGMAEGGEKELVGKTGDRRGDGHAGGRGRGGGGVEEGSKRCKARVGVRGRGAEGRRGGGAERLGSEG